MTMIKRLHPTVTAPLFNPAGKCSCRAHSPWECCRPRVNTPLFTTSPVAASLSSLSSCAPLPPGDTAQRTSPLRHEGSLQHQQHDVADIIIVGAGIIGCAAALRFAQQGLKVHLLDSRPIGMGASYGNAGHIATEQVFPPASPAILRSLPRMLLDTMGPLRIDWRYLGQITPWLAKMMANMRPIPFKHSVQALRILNEHSLTAWQHLLASIGEEALLHCRGNLTVYEKPRSAVIANALKERMNQEGVSVRSLTRDQLLEREPYLGRNILGGLEFTDTAHVVDPYRVVRTLAEAAQAKGTRFTQCQVTKAALNREGVSVSTSNQTLNARRVLIACGAHSADLVRQLTEHRIPLDTERGYHLMLPHESQRLNVPVNSIERNFIMTPLEGGLRLAGTVEFAGLQRPPRMARAWHLQHHANALFDTPLNTHEAEPWMGFRPSLPDALPVIDSLAKGRLLLAFGHQHLGLTQAALTADLLSDMVRGDPSLISGASSYPIDLAPYRLSRFF